MSTTAIIVAAGASSRMGKTVSKQLLPINGVPVVAHTLAAFEQAQEIQSIILVCREQDISKVLCLVEQQAITKVAAVVKGAGTRQGSVEKGLGQIPQDTQYIAVHDGARPLISSKDINRVVKDARRHNCAALGVPVKDTLKLINKDGFIESTPNRENMVSVQTPQVFKKEMYLHAVKLAQEQGLDYTDDCQLLEAANQQVYITRGSYENIKVTTPEDIDIAESFLKKRSN